ncbi:hypothetical protein E7T06_19735 [Deinococcus sp. Arct2-2]|uniref:DUF6220 domain-containing protein n=1 Tax=Deinococcus sp. Arct2-2 TaxID=2568653 RepID=UPI0010A52728|nr:DUF6220 domain-containing protein [Deinococcus sp. Arct2-2]THF67732.1 hypothetical protein E7T06_19735 [Deinococcus sp. Arct2-2]
MTTVPTTPLPTFSGARWTYLVLCSLLVLCILAQVFLAGMGALVSPSFYGLHKTFGDWFGLLILPMAIAAFVGRLPRSITLATVGLFGLYALQYVFFELGATASFLRAFHVVNALVIFWSATRLAQAVWHLLRARA